MVEPCHKQLGNFASFSRHINYLDNMIDSVEYSKIRIMLSRVIVCLALTVAGKTKLANQCSC